MCKGDAKPANGNGSNLALADIIIFQTWIDKVGLTSQQPYCFKCEVQNWELLAFYRHDLYHL